MKARLLSAAILLPIVIAIVVMGGAAFGLLIVMVVGLAAAEYVRMLRRRYEAVSLLWVGLSILPWLVEAWWARPVWVTVGVPLDLMAVTVWMLYCRQRDAHLPTPTAQWALTVAGGLYLGMGGNYLLKVRLQPHGLWWTLTALAVIWIADSGAYFVGRRWGKHKMLPFISPGKSWEGYAAELVSGTLAGFVGGGLWPRVAGGEIGLNALRGAVLGFVLAALTPAGDFFVSMIKREAGVKDSSSLIPGHGGMFDRIDSLIWAGVITWVMVSLWAG